MLSRTGHSGVCAPLLLLPSALSCRELRGAARSTALAAPVIVSAKVMQWAEMHVMLQHVLEMGHSRQVDLDSGEQQPEEDDVVYAEDDTGHWHFFDVRFQLLLESDAARLRRAGGPGRRTDEDDVVRKKLEQVGRIEKHVCGTSGSLSWLFFYDQSRALRENDFVFGVGLYNPLHQASFRREQHARRTVISV